MQIAEQTVAVPDVDGDSFSAVEFELALDMQDLTEFDFADCVRAAAGSVGGEFLFDMPADGTLDNVSRIAAVRVESQNRDRIAFAVLNDEGTEIRVPDDDEVDERLRGFARAFVGVLTHIRDDLPFGSVRPEGTA
ncbi:hypothetical protein [Aurantimonas manganoxydans]|uniref:hypothetical protein n=1 Tax=Aurantimonas manganoxydans TaxID=651183 RepID=UPI0002F10951|nr:hypothetical protein [Aurantimonas manganoxydans]